ncbi:MAG: hypothetical protein AAF926_09195, partial [Pseudomonadota bacterium]
FDAMAGVTNPAYLTSRLFWLLAAGGLAWLAGFAFTPGKPKISRRKVTGPSGPATFSDDPVAVVTPSRAAITSRIGVHVAELFRPRLIILPILAVALAGIIFPLRGMVGPALSLLLIFPLTRYGARWRPLSVEQWLGTMPVSLSQQFLTRLILACAACLLLLVPSFAGLTSQEWGDVIAIGIGLPIMAVVLGHVTRGPVAARLILLILWYGYLNMGGPLA